MARKIHFIFISFILVFFVCNISAQQVYRDVKPGLEIVCSEAPIKTGEKADFSAKLSPSLASASYNWTVSNGTITKGQGTSAIEVETSNVVGEITATVTIGNVYFEQLTGSCTVSTFQPPQAKILADFPFSTQGYIKMMMDSTIFLELGNDPTAQGYIFIFPKTPRDKVIIEKIILNQIRVRNFDASRINIVLGAKNSKSVIQFWSVPAGAEVPIPEIKEKAK
jgi:hypothetical protein